MTLTRDPGKIGRTRRVFRAGFVWGWSKGTRPGDAKRCIGVMTTHSHRIFLTIWAIATTQSSTSSGLQDFTGKSTGKSTDDAARTIEDRHQVRVLVVVFPDSCFLMIHIILIVAGFHHPLFLCLLRSMGTCSKGLGNASGEIMAAGLTRPKVARAGVGGYFS